jgi:hypothetical protein
MTERAEDRGKDREHPKNEVVVLMVLVSKGGKAE